MMKNLRKMKRKNKTYKNSGKQVHIRHMTRAIDRPVCLGNIIMSNLLKKDPHYS